MIIHRVERLFDRLKQVRCVATRCDKPLAKVGGLVRLAAASILLA